MTGRVLAIGDIHGCGQALAGLILLLDLRPDDTVIAIGDYIDRGPDSRAVLDQMIALQRRCHLVPLLGNHEEMPLKARSSPPHLKMWLMCGGKEAFKSYGRDADLDCIPAEHWHFIDSCLDWTWPLDSCGRLMPLVGSVR